MSALDAINGKMGSGTLRPAGMGIKREWGVKFDVKSPAWTTNWDELPAVRA